MYQVSFEFLREVRRDHVAVAWVDVVLGQHVQRLDAEVTGGSVRIDFDSTTRRGVSINLATEYTYDELAELLNPLQSVFRPYRGVRFADGTVEAVPLGDFYVSRWDAEDSGGVQTVTMSGLDASKRCMKPVAGNFTIKNGTKYIDAIAPMLRRCLPTLEFRIPDTQWSVPDAIISEDKVPWTEARRMAVSVGHDLWVARDGVANTGSRPLVAEGLPVATFEHGKNSVFWEPKRSFDADSYPNVIVVTGSNSSTSGAQPRGVAWDNNPRSKTYRYGPYGERTETYSYEYITDSKQAAAAARTILARRLGPQDEITMSCVPNPALDEADVVQVTYERLGLDHENVLIAGIEYPLLATDEASMTLRRSIITEDFIPG